MQTLTFVIVILSLTVACGSPPEKLNSATNGADNAANSGNNQNSQNNVNGQTNSSTSGPTVLNPDDYDQSCDWDSECALVWGGDVCGCGSICPDAISSEAVDDFNADREAIECDDSDPIACPAAACQEQLAICTSAGSCSTTPDVVISVDRFDKGCEVDEDCVLVNVGQICSTCNCQAGAINGAELAEYEEAYPPVDCRPGPIGCDCEPPNKAWCNEGTCDTTFE